MVFATTCNNCPVNNEATRRQKVQTIRAGMAARRGGWYNGAATEGLMDKWIMDFWDFLYFSWTNKNHHGLKEHVLIFVTVSVYAAMSWLAVCLPVFRDDGLSEGEWLHQRVSSRKLHRELALTKNLVHFEVFPSHHKYWQVMVVSSWFISFIYQNTNQNRGLRWWNWIIFNRRLETGSAKGTAAWLIFSEFFHWWDRHASIHMWRCEMVCMIHSALCLYMRPTSPGPYKSYNTWWILVIFFGWGRTVWRKAQNPGAEVPWALWAPRAPKYLLQCGSVNPTWDIHCESDGLAIHVCIYCTRKCAQTILWVFCFDCFLTCKVLGITRSIDGQIMFPNLGKCLLSRSDVLCGTRYLSFLVSRHFAYPSQHSRWKQT